MLAAKASSIVLPVSAKQHTKMTNSILSAIKQHAASTPEATAVIGSHTSLKYRELQSQINLFSKTLDASCLGLLMDNSPAWLVADLVCLQQGITCVPLPPFFSKSQLKNAINNANIDCILCDDLSTIAPLLDTEYQQSELTVAGQTLQLIKLAKPVNESLKGVAKVTYTSGTSGTSKGVCLSSQAIEMAVTSLCQASESDRDTVTLALLPLAVLLENIGAAYTPLVVGGRCILLNMRDIGIHGAANIDSHKLNQCIHQYRPSILILMPQMLRVLLESTHGSEIPSSLKFIAIGGAPVSKALLQRARNIGLPVFQGYGLSEASSVVSLNTANANRVGSVGKVLPHATIKFSQDNEILVRGSCYIGYLEGEHHEHDDWLATGDLGYIDSDGFLFISGRKKSIFITALGRNVAPEWVEGELQNNSVIAQSAVFGEGKPYNVAIIVPRLLGGKIPDQRDLETAVLIANEQLPEYARIKHYHVSDAPFSLDNGHYTATGRPRRESIASAYANEINNLYIENT